MFKESTTNRQIDFLGDISSNLDSKRDAILNDPNAWHNQFFTHVVCQFDESCFKALYSSDMGRSNSPVRVLLAMMALKEGFGWSDEQLYQQAYFNLQVMKALGFENLSDTVPAPSTYYLFKQSIYQYQVKTGHDLIEEAFKALTKSQAEFFDVNGEKIRMDSKLIGSNIVRCSRLQLIISCLREFYRSLDDERKGQLDNARRETLEELTAKKPNQIVYPLSEEEKSQKLVDLGELLLYIKRLYDDSDSDQYQIVERLLDDQYQIEDEQTVLKDGKEIAADSIQSPHDTDAAYRKKSHQTVNGYSVNVTETCNDEGLNLIVDVQTEKATRADVDYVETALEKAKDIVGPVNQVYMDGAYQSPENQTYGEENDIEMIFTGIQGADGRFEFIESADGLSVLDKSTGIATEAVEYKPGHYKIRLVDGKWRYFKPEQIKCSKRRQELKDLPKEKRNRRNNVEASVFQMSYHSRNNKTKYRGLFKHRAWATCRAIWVNLVRIKNHVKKSATDAIPAPAG